MHILFIYLFLISSHEVPLHSLEIISLEYISHILFLCSCFPGDASYICRCPFLSVRLEFFLVTYNYLLPLKLMQIVQTQFVSLIHKRKSPQTKISPSCTSFLTGFLGFLSCAFHMKSKFEVIFFN